MVFMRGERGVGYYLDPSLAATGEKEQSTGYAGAAAPSSDAAEKALKQPDSAVQSFQFELLQTRPAIALLVQVPGVLKDSVAVTYRDYSLDLCFRAATATAGSDDELSQQQKPLQVYGLTIHFPESLSGRGLDTARCTWDVAARNMVVALEKRVPGMWLETGENGEGRSGQQVSVPHSTSKYAGPFISTEQPLRDNTKLRSEPQPSLSGTGSSSNTNTDSLVSAMQSLRFSDASCASCQALYDLD